MFVIVTIINRTVFLLLLCVEVSVVNPQCVSTILKMVAPTQYTKNNPNLNLCVEVHRYIHHGHIDNSDLGQGNPPCVQYSTLSPPITSVPISCNPALFNVLASISAGTGI